MSELLDAGGGVMDRKNQHCVLAGEGKPQVCVKCGENLALVTSTPLCAVVGYYREIKRQRELRTGG